MEILGSGIAWLLDPAHWSGSNGIPVRMLEHVALASASLVIAALIALPVGLYTGHTGRWGTTVTNVANLGRAVPSYALLLVFFTLTGALGAPTTAANGTIAIGSGATGAISKLIEILNVRLPADAVLGEPGKGYALALETLDTFRPSVGAAGCGMAARALDFGKAAPHLGHIAAPGCGHRARERRAAHAKQVAHQHIRDDPEELRVFDPR